MPASPPPRSSTAKRSTTASAPTASAIGHTGSSSRPGARDGATGTSRLRGRVGVWTMPMRVRGGDQETSEDQAAARPVASTEHERAAADSGTRDAGGSALLHDEAVDV